MLQELGGIEAYRFVGERRLDDAFQLYHGVCEFSNKSLIDKLMCFFVCTLKFSALVKSRNLGDTRRLEFAGGTTADEDRCVDVDSRILRDKVLFLVWLWSA